MTNTEIIQAIRNEIERLKAVQLKRIQEGDLVDAEPYDKNEAYNGILSFLDTLESEKPMNQNGLEREIARCLWKLSDDPSNEELRMFASHFAEWGAEHLANAHKTFTTTNGLEEAADNHIRKVVDAAGHPGWDWTTQDIADAFIAGAKWQKEQMMKEAVEGEVVKDWDNNLSVKSGVICGFKFGEKVRVIVLPKED